MQIVRALVAFAFVSVLVAGCGSEPAGLVGPGPAGSPLPLETAVEVIGASGGTLAAGGATLVVPPGALASSVEITLESGTTNGLGWCEIRPSGLSFTGGATVRLQKPAPGEPGQLYGLVSSVEGTLTATDSGGTLEGTVTQSAHIEIRDDD
jgi:hypothetical protein